MAILFIQILISKQYEHVSHKHSVFMVLTFKAEHFRGHSIDNIQTHFPIAKPNGGGNGYGMLTMTCLFCIGSTYDAISYSVWYLSQFC